MIHFIIPGKPVPLQRARHSGGHSYDTPHNRNAKANVAWLAKAAMLGQRPLEGPVRLTVRAVFEPAPSWSKARRSAAMGSHHTQRPDLDNIEKLIADALGGVAWIDDCQVAESRTTKLWGPVAQTTVTVEVLS